MQAFWKKKFENGQYNVNFDDNLHKKDLNEMVFRGFMGRRGKKCLQHARNGEKIIENHLLSEYTHIGKER